MKKFSRFAAVMLVLVALVVAAVACKQSEPESIAVSNASGLRTEFVLGQDYDFRNGTLLVKYKDSNAEVALTDSAVNITGYDKNKLGKQTLTIEYKGKTTTLDVTVVNRFQYINVETKYFVEEEFDKSGQVKLTYNNGTSKTLSITEVVDLGDFDSSAEVIGQELNVSYEGYEDIISVNVYKIDSMSLHGLTRTAYKSHEEKIPLDKAYLSISGGDGALVRPTVSLTDKMIVDYNPGAATYEHRKGETPLSQTVKIKYASKTKDFPITIEFSDISIIQLRGSEVSEPNWSAGITAVDPATGEKAREAMELYKNLSSTEKGLITTATNKKLSVAQKNRLARIAAVYCYDLWLESAKEFENIFVLTDNGVSFTGENPESIGNYAKLRNADIDLYVLAETLKAIYTDFGTVSLVKIGDVDKTITSYLTKVRNMDPETLKKIPGMLDFAFTVYNLLKDIPAGWTPADLKNTYSARITEAYAEITSINNPYRNERNLFGMISLWRENSATSGGKNDFFEIIYSHYYYNVTNYTTYINVLKNIYLPGKLEEMYTCVTNMAVYSELLRERDAYMLFDSTMFMISYKNLERVRQEIEADTDVMYAYLYANLSYSGFVTSGPQTFSQLRSILLQQDYGYFYICDNMLSDSQFDHMLDTYLEVYDKYLSGDASYGAGLEALLAEYLRMTPNWQFGFMVAINPHYEYTLQRGATNLNLITTLNGFADMVKDYYSQKITSSTVFNTFERMLNAAEYYSLYQVTLDTTILQRFYDQMVEVVDKDYGSGLDKVLYDTYVKSNFEIYAKIYKAKKGLSAAPEMSNDMKKVLDELTLTIYGDGTNYIGDLYTFADLINKNNYWDEPAFISGYAYARNLMDQILNSGDEGAIWALSHDNIVPMTNSSGVSVGNATRDFIMNTLRGEYVRLLKKQRSVASVGVKFTPWSYWTQEMESAYADAYVFFRRNFATAKFTVDSTTRAFNAIKAFRELDVEDQFIFMLIDDGNPENSSQGNYFHRGILTFFDEVFPSSGANKNIGAAGKALINFTISYIFYYKNAAPTSTAMTAFDASYATLQAAIRTLLGLGVSDEITQDDIDDGKGVSTNNKEILEWYEYCRDEYETYLDTAKLKAVNDLETYFGALVQGNYTIGQWNQIVTAVQNGKNAINSSSGFAKVAEELQNARNAVEAIRTVRAKELAVKELEEYVEKELKLSSDDYTPENWTKVQTAVQNGKDAINKSETNTVAKVNSELDKAEAAIRAIPTKS